MMTATANLVCSEESLQQKLNIEQSAHSIVPAGCLVAGCRVAVVGYVCSYSLELLSPTL